MDFIQQNSSRSTLIRAIQADVYADFARHLHRVQLEEGALLARAGGRIDMAYVPETVVTSIVDLLGDGSRVEIGLAGHEGLAGWPLLLGSKVSPHDVSVHTGGGSALGIKSGALVALCAAHPSAAALFMRYVVALTVQVGRTAVSNLRDPVERRLSRWLLMFHDRMTGDEIDLTHRTIAGMLGIRRASVTNGLHTLEGLHVIRNQRGRIVIRDRAGLRRIAGEAYGHFEAHYSQSIAPFGKCNGARPSLILDQPALRNGGLYETGEQRVRSERPAL